MLVLVEAKRHGRKVERSYVQILHDKLRSVGAQKAVLISTAPFQRGALEYALRARIALVTVTEGQSLFHTRSRDRGGLAPTREQSAARGAPTSWRTPTAVPAGHRHAGSRGSPDAVAETLLGVDPGRPPTPTMR